MPRLKQLVKDGIKENWSRTGIRAINVPGKGKYDVFVQVIESSNGYGTNLKWAKDVQKDCERSNNPGIPVLVSNHLIAFSLSRVLCLHF